MPKDIVFVPGTVVTADFLNTHQELDTGAIWGLGLSQPSSAAIETKLAGTDTQSTAYIGGKPAWRTSPTSPVSASGSAGARDIYLVADTSDPANPTFTVSLHIPPATPAGNYRKVGTGYWDTTTFRNIKLLNGVQVDANQNNSIVFRSISSSVSDRPVTISGYAAQNVPQSRLLSIGVDTGTYVERLGVSGTGLVTFSAALDTTPVVNAQVAGDAVPRVAITAAGLVEWSDGTLSTDTSIRRGGIGTVKIMNGAQGGILDVATLKNTETTNSGYIRVMGDINLDPTQVIRYNNVPLGSVHLADSGDILHKAGTETVTGAKTFTGGIALTTTPLTITDVAINVTRSVSTSAVLTGKVVGDSVERVFIGADASIELGSGSGTRDWKLQWLSTNVAALASGDKLQQSTAPTVNNDLVNKLYTDNSINERAATRAFAIFLG